MPKTTHTWPSSQGFVSLLIICLFVLDKDSPQKTTNGFFYFEGPAVKSIRQFVSNSFSVEVKTPPKKLQLGSRSSLTRAASTFPSEQTGGEAANEQNIPPPADWGAYGGDSREARRWREVRGWGGGLWETKRRQNYSDKAVSCLKVTAWSRVLECCQKPGSCEDLTGLPGKCQWRDEALGNASGGLQKQKVAG